MEKNYWKPIRNFLDELDVLHPKTTDVQKRINSSHPVRACLFDVYGTLLISASGDIDQTGFSNYALEYAMDKSGIALIAGEASEQDLQKNILKAFKNAVKLKHKQKKEQGIAFPEVDFVHIWEQVLRRYADAGRLCLHSEANIMKFTFLFELMSNKLYPMPGMKDVVETFNQHKIPLGIISNAQFFTPMLMNYFLNNELKEGTGIAQFNSDLVEFSYLKGRAKPDLFLFEELKSQLAKKYGIDAKETLYIGNDMYNDILPANQTGFQTVLFAGDMRSLRWRAGMPELKDVEPDHIILELADLLAIVGLDY